MMDCIVAVERAVAATADAELAREVARLSDLYTTGRGALAREQASASFLAAKCEYFLASDAPKVGLALDECARREASFARLAGLDVVRITDLGAGVGATSTGCLAWLAAARARDGATRRMRIELHAVELGEPAARAFERSVAAAAAHAGFDLALKIEARDFRNFLIPPSDLVLCQTALNEMLVDATYGRDTVAMVRRWAESAPLLVIEPALKTTTRALMALRDAILAPGGVSVIAPCLHQKPCPMLARGGDWCHEARRIAPTPRVAAIDRIVGRRDGRALFAFLATIPGSKMDLAEGSDGDTPTAVGRTVPLRIVTDPLGSRGKTERLVCRGDGELRMMRLLDRETRAGNVLFADAERGALLRVDPLPENDRISPEATVENAFLTNST